MGNATISLTFRIFNDNQLVREQTLSQGVIKIGKVPSAHLRIDDESVSRMHAIIEVLNGEISIIDLGSTRGTFVNGQKINKAKLVHGDSITIGSSRIELAMASTAPVVAPVVAVPPPVPMAKPAAPVLASVPMTPAAKPMMSAPVAPVSKPVAPMMSTPVAPMSVATAMSMPASAPAVVGERAIEVATMLGDSVVDVKHCSDPQGGKVTRKTWAFVATGAAALLASTIAFGVSMRNESANDAKLQKLLKSGAPMHAHRPNVLPLGVDLTAFGGLALGLYGMTAGLARARRERKSPYYRIGTAAGVEQPIEHAPTESFPMVAPKGDDFVFNYGAGMDGEMIVDGASTPFAQLAAQGRAVPSTSTPGAFEVAIPMNARIRAHAGQTTFVVTSVAKPREEKTSAFVFDGRLAKFVGGSVAAHAALLLLLWNTPVEDAGVNIDAMSSDELNMHSSLAAQETAPPETPENVTTGEDSGPKGAGAKMALESGAAGKPNATREDGHLRIKQTQEQPQLARAEALRQARESGVLGSTQAIQQTIASITGGANMSSGFDLDNIVGPLYGAEGEGKGNFGYGRTGYGPGGGCYGTDCGLVGDGRYGTIGNGKDVGDGYEPGTGHGGMRKRVSAVPPVTPGPPNPIGSLDKSIIKRYIRRNLSKISYCYESELLARPSLGGELVANFLIAGDGTVQSSNARGFDTKVGTCVAAIIKNIGFPRPSDGGTVQVNYPFTFRAPVK